MTSAAERLTAWILERAEDEPLERRASIYRDAAATVADEARAVELLRLAEELDTANRHCRQLRLQLQFDAA